MSLPGLTGRKVHWPKTVFLPRTTVPNSKGNAATTSLTSLSGLPMNKILGHLDPRNKARLRATSRELQGSVPALTSSEVGEARKKYLGQRLSGALDRGVRALAFKILIHFHKRARALRKVLRSAPTDLPNASHAEFKRFSEKTSYRVAIEFQGQSYGLRAHLKQNFVDHGNQTHIEVIDLWTFYPKAGARLTDMDDEPRSEYGRYGWYVGYATIDGVNWACGNCNRAADMSYKFFVDRAPSRYGSVLVKNAFQQAKRWYNTHSSLDAASTRPRSHNRRRVQTRSAPSSNARRQNSRNNLVARFDKQWFGGP